MSKLLASLLLTIVSFSLAADLVAQSANPATDKKMAVILRQALQFKEQGNFDKARPLFEKAAEEGWCEAQYELGYSYLLKSEFAKAEPLLLRSAEQGYAAAKTLLGGIYSESLDDAKKARAFSLWKEAAKQGNVSATSSLSRAYLKGLGVAPDGRSSLKWAMIAASLGEKSGTSNAARRTVTTNEFRKIAVRALSWKAVRQVMVHVRRKHGLDEETIASIDRCEELEILNGTPEGKDGFKWIQVKTKKGISGWIPARLVASNDRLLYSQLVVAISLGDFGQVKKWLALGAKPNESSIKGRIALALAIETRNNRITDLLIKAGASLTQSGPDGVTPLHAAIKANNKAMTIKLIKNGADIEASDKNGMRPLHVAGLVGNGPMVRILLKAGSKVDSLNAKGETPLIFAAGAVRSQALKLLIKAGANTQHKSRAGATPLHGAVNALSLSCAETLLKSGANPNPVDTKRNEAPLITAILLRDPPMVRLLMKSKADIKTKSTFGTGPLVTAVTVLGMSPASDELSTVKELLDAGVNPDGDDSKNSPISAMSHNEFDRNAGIARALISAGANVNKQTGQSRSSIFHNLMDNEDGAKWAQFLLDNNADVNMKDQYGATPLDMALSFYGSNKDSKLVAWLKKNGAKRGR